MKTAAIAIDRWKEPTFRKALEDAGFAIETATDGPTAETMFLKVPYTDENFRSLAEACADAQLAAKRGKLH